MIKYKKEFEDIEIRKSILKNVLDNLCCPFHLTSKTSDMYELEIIAGFKKGEFILFFFPDNGCCDYMDELIEKKYNETSVSFLSELPPLST